MRSTHKTEKHVVSFERNPNLIFPQEMCYKYEGMDDLTSIWNNKESVLTCFGWRNA